MYVANPFQKKQKNKNENKIPFIMQICAQWIKEQNNPNMQNRIILIKAATSESCDSCINHMNMRNLQYKILQKKMHGKY